MPRCPACRSAPRLLPGFESSSSDSVTTNFHQSSRLSKRKVAIPTGKLQLLRMSLTMMTPSPSRSWHISYDAMSYYTVLSYIILYDTYRAGGRRWLQNAEPLSRPRWVPSLSFSHNCLGNLHATCMCHSPPPQAAAAPRNKQDLRPECCSLAAVGCSLTSAGRSIAFAGR